MSGAVDPAETTTPHATPEQDVLLDRARAGDETAFSELVDPYRHELLVHCYRMLASAHDAEDVLQTVLLSAWLGIGRFERRASVRTWLYRIATNRCLNHLRDDRHRATSTASSEQLSALAAPTSTETVTWLEPFADRTSARTGAEVSPESAYELKETISLAFVTSLQLLTAAQRAAVILRDVLGYSAAESADVLDTTVDSVNGALKRGRGELRAHTPASASRAASSADEQRLVDRFTHAYEAGDLDALTALLTEDVRMSMPPVPLVYDGVEANRQFFTAVVFTEGRRFRTVPASANGQPSVASYVSLPPYDVARPHSLLVLTVRADGIAAVTRFGPDLFDRFGLPPELDGPAERVER